MVGDEGTQPGERQSLAWSVQEAVEWAQDRLAETTEAALTARMLLAHVLGSTVSELFVHPERVLADDEAAAYRSLVARRAQHEPVAYLVGHRAFLDLDLVVDERVLVPRPETELLVEQALRVAQRWAGPRIADVGTGSGGIAVSLALHLPEATVYALDCSAGALEVARQNARRYEVMGRILFLQGDLLAPLIDSDHAPAPVPGALALSSTAVSADELHSPVHRNAVVDLIVANLPYVSQDEYAALAPDIRLYEPRQALVSGADGLDAIRCLLDTARPHLAEDGVLLLEIGAAQGRAVSALAACAFPAARVSLLPDYAGRDRVVCVELEPREVYEHPTHHQ
jgi:release factor glutamine methyltransferase